jgi:YD repeat-containing protein
VLATYAYDNLGRRTSLTRGNGVVTSYAYDGASRLDTLTHNLTGTSHDQTFDFSYNAAFQALARDGSNSAYDWTPLAPGATSYADNGLNQYTSAAARASPMTAAAI